MKKISFVLAICAMALASCSPSVYTLGFEARQPSKSGLDLARKSMAVVYDESSRDTAFNAAFAESFATELEKDYFDGKPSVEIFSADFSGGDYASRDSMVSLVMQTGADVVFLLPNPERGTLITTGDKTMAPVSVKMYAYDSLSGEKDKVRNFNGTVNVTGDGTLDENSFRPVMEKRASYIGKQASKSFLSTWQEERHGLYYYDSFSDIWIEALRHAADFKWKEAITLWMTVLSGKNPEKKACAEYNIAVGCYMTEDYALALKWLDRADADCPLSLSASLRKQIQEKSKR